MARISKLNRVAALVVGFSISTTFMAIPSMRDGINEWASVQLPGWAAAYVFWGAVNNSVFWGTVLAWAVNGLVYSGVALLFVSLLTIAVRR